MCPPIEQTQVIVKHVNFIFMLIYYCKLGRDFVVTSSVCAWIP